jgi:hypothetical protein
MTVKMYPFFRDPPQFGKRKDLKPAAVRQDWTIPTHEPMQPATLPDHIQARSQKEMIGVPQDDLGANLGKLGRSSCFNSTLSAYRHKHWSIDRAVSRSEAAAAGPAHQVSGNKLKMHFFKGSSRIVQSEIKLVNLNKREVGNGGTPERARIADSKVYSRAEVCGGEPFWRLTTRPHAPSKCGACDRGEILFPLAQEFFFRFLQRGDFIGR